MSASDSTTCFLSHPWADGIHHFAIHLREELKKWRIEAWLDEYEMPASTDPVSATESSIRAKAEVFVIILASATLVSIECRRELETAYRFNKQIVQLRLEKAEKPSLQIPPDWRTLLGNSIFIRHTGLPLEACPDSVIKKLVDGIQEAARQARLIAILDDPDSDRRTESARLIGLAGYTSALPHFERRIAQEDDPTVRNAFIEPLESFAIISGASGKTARGLLSRLTRDSHVLVRRSAEAALLRIAQLI